jgi:hypothetical protein
MKKVFLFTDKSGQTTVFGIALSDPADYKKITLRYYDVTDDFKPTELTTYCNETHKIENDCRRWCNLNDLILWSY